MSWIFKGSGGFPFGLDVGRSAGGGVPIQGCSFDLGTGSMRKRVHVSGNGSTTTGVHSFFGNSSARMRVHSSYIAYSFLLFYLFSYEWVKKLPNLSMVCCGYLMCDIYIFILAPYTPGTDLHESFI